MKSVGNLPTDRGSQSAPCECSDGRSRAPREMLWSKRVIGSNGWWARSHWVEGRPTAKRPPCAKTVPSLKGGRGASESPVRGPGDLTCRRDICEH
jgi:hypothetical protein